MVRGVAIAVVGRGKKTRASEKPLPHEQQDVFVALKWGFVYLLRVCVFYCVCCRGWMVEAKKSYSREEKVKESERRRRNRRRKGSFLLDNVLLLPYILVDNKKNNESQMILQITIFTLTQIEQVSDTVTL